MPHGPASSAIVAAAAAVGSFGGLRGFGFWASRHDIAIAEDSQAFGVESRSLDTEGREPPWDEVFNSSAKAHVVDLEYVEKEFLAQPSQLHTFLVDNLEALTGFAPLREIRCSGEVVVISIAISLLCDLVLAWASLVWCCRTMGCHIFAGRQATIGNDSRGAKDDGATEETPPSLTSEPLAQANAEGGGLPEEPQLEDPPLTPRGPRPSSSEVLMCWLTRTPTLAPLPTARASCLRSRSDEAQQEVSDSTPSPLEAKRVQFEPTEVRREL